MFRVVLFSVGLLVLFSGCIQSNNTTTDFASSQNLPKMQSPKILYEDKTNDVTFFSVKFGEGQDCMAGCIYGEGIGLQHRNKVGWISIEDNYSIHSPNKIDTKKYSYYDFDAGDGYLFSASALNSIKTKTEHPGIFPAYLNQLAFDSDTPPSTIALILKEDYHIALDMLRDPGIQQNRDVLLVIAAIPELNETNVDDSIRERANGYLAELS